jgi:N-acetylglucosamine malate deacetylase 1
MDFTKILSAFDVFFTPSKLSKKSSHPQVIMILSPHPDDESIISTLALRLARENGAHIINVAVTLGSNKARQKARLKELESACEHLEIELALLSESWTQKARELKSLIQKYQPQLILAPHLKDHHPTHIKTGELLKKVGATLKNFTCLVAWSEFWGINPKPNILVEAPAEILKLQMEALAMHVGEVERNPYHLRLPAWMMDSVRRGSEVIGGKGASSAQMAFGVLYQLQILKNGTFKTPKINQSMLSAESDMAQMFKLILAAASGSKTKVK